MISTRLRYIKDANPDMLWKTIDSLNQKVEIKSIVKDGRFWYCWFVITDFASEPRNYKTFKLENKE